MPLRIEERECRQANGEPGQWVLVNTETGRVESCHATESLAQAAMRAREANGAQQAEIPDDVVIDHRLVDEIFNRLQALMPDATFPLLSIESVFPDRVIVRDVDGRLWQYPMSFGENHRVQLGERVAVEQDFRPVQQAAAARQGSPQAARQGSPQAGVRILQAVDKEGREWEVLILKPGLGANRQFFPPETLRQAAPVFEGARAFCLEDAQHSRTGDKSAKQIVGWISQAAYREPEGITGRLHLLQTADWLRQNLLDSHAQGKPDLYGLSVDAPGTAAIRQITHQGEPTLVQWFTAIKPPATVDVVWNPGTPGGFQRALNARDGDGRAQKEELPMLEKLLKILQAKRPDLHAKIDPAAITEERVLQLLEEAVPAQQAQKGSDPARGAQEGGQTHGLSDEDRATIRQAHVMQWNGRVRELLADSNLPEVMQAKLRKAWMDQPPAGPVEQAVERVKQAITAEKETLDALTEGGKVKGLGYAHDVHVEGETERLQQAMDKLFGLKDVEGDMPAFHGIRQAYIRITGDSELAGRSANPGRLEKLNQAVRAFQANQVDSFGVPLPGFVQVQQAQSSAAWPLILGNTLARRLVQDYMEVDYGENRIISNRRRAADFRTLEAIRLNYAADLPVVDPEVADYTETPTLSEEGVNYAVSTRGRIMTVTRKTIINDDLGAVLRGVQREGRAARRTFARVVWNLFINNATYDGDAVAWFAAGHNNLGAVALTADATGIATVVAALNRLMDQTEPGSGEKLGGAWWGTPITLVVPTALQSTAKQLNQSSGVPGAANEGDNPIFGLFGAPQSPERIFVNPLFTDANDWGLFRDPSDMDIIEVAFLNGREQPETFVADQQTVGQMFLADKIQYKIRHEYGAEVLDFRSADKSVVA